MSWESVHLKPTTTTIPIDCKTSQTPNPTGKFKDLHFPKNRRILNSGNPPGSAAMGGAPLTIWSLIFYRDVESGTGPTGIFRWHRSQEQLLMRPGPNSIWEYAINDGRDSIRNASFHFPLSCCLVPFETVCTIFSVKHRVSTNKSMFCETVEATQYICFV